MTVKSIRSIKQQLTQIKNAITKLDLTLEELEMINFKIQQIKRILKGEHK